jgi:hypothetical protein
MAQTIKIKRSAVPGKVPTTSDLDLGELGLNTYDGKLFTKKDDGAESIVELSGGGGGSGPIAETAQVISADLTLSTGSNGLSVGPVEVAAGYAVTVPANAIWMII